MAEAAENPRAVTGNNRPPVTEIWDEENKTLAARIAEDNAALKKEKDALIATGETMPKTIKNDKESALISDHVKELTKMIAKAERVRVATKAPVLVAVEIIDSLFKKFKSGPQAQITELNARGTAYDLKIEEKRRNKLEAEAQAAREEEDRLRAAAAKAAKGKNTDKAMDAVETAAVARETRVAAEVAADVKPQEITRVTGSSSTSQLVEEWHGTIEDFDKLDVAKLGKYISRTELEKAAERAGKALMAEGVGTIKGVKIYSEKVRKVS